MFLRSLNKLFIELIQSQKENERENERENEKENEIEIRNKIEIERKMSEMLRLV
jgi:hypothetical protein